MTREDLVKNWNIIEHFKNGGRVQSKNMNGDWVDSVNPSFDFCSWEYRIKPSPKIVPYTFDDAEHLIGRVVKHKKRPELMVVTLVNSNGVGIANTCYTFSDLVNDFTFPDGRPCGNIVEDVTI